MTEREIKKLRSIEDDLLRLHERMEAGDIRGRLLIAVEDMAAMHNRKIGRLTSDEEAGKRGADCHGGGADSQ